MAQNKLKVIDTDICYFIVVKHEWVTLSGENFQRCANCGLPKEYIEGGRTKAP